MNFNSYKFTPRAFSPLIWLESNSLLVPTNGEVGTWQDSGPRQDNAIQSAASKQPLLKRDAYGNAIVRFDGINDYMNSTVGHNFAGATVFVVVQRTGAATYQGAVSCSSPDGSQHTFGLALHNDSGYGPIIIFVNPAGASNGAKGGSLPTDKLHLITATFAGGDTTTLANYRIWDDGEPVTISSPGSIGTGAVSVGIFVGGDEFQHFEGDIGELLIFDRALTEPERLLVQTYLNNKFRCY